MFTGKPMFLFTTLKWMDQPTLIIRMVRQDFLLPRSGDSKTDVWVAFDANTLWE